MPSLSDAYGAEALDLRHYRGQVSGDDVHHPREVGFADKGIVEIVAHAALNLLTNDVNVALNVSVGFPQVKLRRAA